MAAASVRHPAGFRDRRRYGPRNTAYRRDLRSNKLIDGVTSVNSRPVIRRISDQGQIAYIRGLEITLEFDEAAFEGTGVFLLGAVMSIFFSKFVSINAFTETVIRTAERGEIMLWPANLGSRHIL